MKCYYHIAKSNNPYENLALEEWFFRALQPGEVVFYLWQNDNTVVIGRNQNAWRECRLEEFSAQSGRLARRISGGGAVFHDMGNQNFTFLAENTLYDVERQTEVIRLAARIFGIDARRSGRNDILAGERKFSGNAFHRTQKASFHHGTILISSDMGRLGRFLAPSPEKLQAKGVESVRGRVVNLCELNPDVTPAAMREALLNAFGQVYGELPEPYPLKERLRAEDLEVLIERYESESWRLGRLSAFTWELRRRFSFGELEFQLRVEDGIVQEARVYSDAMDADWVEAVGTALAGCPFTGLALSQAVPTSPHAPGDREEVAQCLRAAISALAEIIHTQATYPSKCF